MPSLQQLKRLQTLFGDIGHEKEILDAEGLRPDSYDLPANEPEPRPEAGPAPETPPDAEAPPRPEAGPAPQAPPDAEAPPRPEAGSAPETPSDTEADAAPSGDEDSAFDDLFSGFSDLITDVPAVDDLPPPPDDDSSSDTSPASPSDETPDIDFSGLDFPGAEEAASTSPPEETPDIDFSGLDFPGAEEAAAPSPPDETPDIDFSGLDFPGAEEAAPASPSDETPDIDFSGLDFPGAEEAASTSPPEETPDIDFSGLDFPGAEEAASTSPSEEEGGADRAASAAEIDDPKPPVDEGAEPENPETEDFDLGSLLQGIGDDEAAADGVSGGAIQDENASALDTPETRETDLESDDIPSFSDISDEEKSSLFPDTPAEAPPDEVAVEPPAADAGKESAKEPGPSSPEAGMESLPNIDDFLAPIDNTSAKPPPEAEEAAADGKSKKQVEAISLTEEQLQRLLDTISSYPLNLRIECEKIIAEEIVEPALLSQFVKLLVRGGNAREAASLAGKILKKKIPLPKSYKTGEELEAERSSFVYIFFHKYFPVIRISLLIAALAASVAYLSYEFLYKPIRADLIYKNGCERIEEGSYTLGNRRFEEAFAIHPVKNWFYRYAELFRDEHQYLYAEEKYDQLLLNYPLDKKGTLDYAAMETDYLRNYEKADSLVRTNILDYKRDDREGLLALGDINLAWGEYDPSRYEEARLAYAKLLAAYGQSDPVMERMLLYFIRTDKLGEVIPIQKYFMDRSKSKISASSLAELGGYLLDKRFEVVKGVPDEHIEDIEGIKDVLLRAGKEDFSLPEVHYHLARYYNNYGSLPEERQTLEIAAETFDTALPESPRRTRYRIDTQLRLALMMIKDREFISAEETLAKGVKIMEDAVDRRVIQRTPEFGELYAYLGDLAYFAKSGDMREAVDFYIDAEENGWAPPEMRYRLGSAYYRLEDYARAMNRFFDVSMETPYNRRLLNALGNAAYMRSDYFAAEGYFKRLLNMLESDRNRLPILLPHERPEHYELVERLMIARNNLGVTYNALAARTGNSSYRAQALGEFSESARAWDALERNPSTLIRAGITDTAIPGASLPYLNIQNTLYPTQDGGGLLFMKIDKDLSDNSWWEELMNTEIP